MEPLDVLYNILIFNHVIHGDSSHSCEGPDLKSIPRQRIIFSPISFRSTSNLAPVICSITHIAVLDKQHLRLLIYQRLKRAYLECRDSSCMPQHISEVPWASATNTMI